MVQNIKFAIDRLKEKGYKSMIINCLEGNPTVEFYKYMGGVIKGRRTDEVSGHTITENVLEFEI